MAEQLGAWRRWWRLPAADKRVVVKVVPMLVVVDLSLRVFGLRRTRRWLLRGQSEAASTTTVSVAPQVLQRAQRLAALAAVAGEHGPWRAGCLRQALVVERSLRRQGLPVQLRIGTRKTGSGHLDAHAWVELDGVALGQPQPAQQAIPGVDQALR